MCDTLSSSAANQGDNTVLVAQGSIASPGATKQLLPPDRVFKNIIKDTYESGAETGLVLLVPSTTNNSVNVIQNGLKIIH